MDPVLGRTRVNLATMSSLQEQQECRQNVWDCFLEFSYCHMPTRVGPTPAGDSQRASQLTDGESERELKLQMAKFTCGNDANQAKNQCTGANRTRGLGLIFRAALFRLDIRHPLFLVIN